jgi:hypothetical protein
MKTILCILGQLDRKFLASARNRYLQSKYREFKPHSGSTVIAIIFTHLFFNLLSGIRFEHESGQSFFFIYKGLLALLSIGAYVFAFYYWRVFFSLRREGVNADRNLFFAESAGLYRKVVFYVTLVPWLIRTIYSHFHPTIVDQEMKRLKYQLPSEYYHEVGLTVFDNIVFSILFVEFLRILLPQTFTWNNKKHMAAVISIAFVLSAVRAIVLNFTRWHGVM